MQYLNPADNSEGKLRDHIVELKKSVKKSLATRRLYVWSSSRETATCVSFELDTPETDKCRNLTPWDDGKWDTEIWRKDRHCERCLPETNESIKR